MDMSGDEDMFAISDEETSTVQTASSNPVEDYLLKELANVQNRIDVTTNEIAEVKTTTARILNALQWRALHGEDVNSDSDCDVSKFFIRHIFNTMLNNIREYFLFHLYSFSLNKKLVLGIVEKIFEFLKLLRDFFFP